MEGEGLGNPNKVAIDRKGDKTRKKCHSDKRLERNFLKIPIKELKKKKKTQGRQKTKTNKRIKHYQPGFWMVVWEEHTTPFWNQSKRRRYHQ